jgi:O-antigen/teichoic acid export membrane protein
LITFFKNKDKNFIELLKGSSISLFLKILGMVFGYAAMLFITNYYGAEEWGIYSLSITLLSIAVLIPKFGFDNALVRIIAEIKAHSSNKVIISVLYKALTISIIISLVIIILMNSFSEILAIKILNQENIKSYIPLISFAIIPLVVLTIISATFQALKKTMLFMLFQTTLINIVFFILLVISYFKNIDVKVFKIYFYAISVSVIVALFFLIVTFIKTLNKNKRVVDNKYSYKKIVKISFPMLLSSSFALLMGWSDIIMLSFYRTTVDIGIYNSSLKLAALSGISLIAINAIATPKFVEFHSNNNIKGLEDTVKKSTKMIFLTTVPVLLILIIFSKEILGLFGSEFTIGYLALIYLCISRFINAISGSVGYIMQMTDQQKVYQNIIIIAFFINLVLNFILIPKYSYNGAAIASSIAMIFWNVALVIIIKKKLGFWTIYIPFITK